MTALELKVLARQQICLRQRVLEFLRDALSATAPYFYVYLANQFY